MKTCLRCEHCHRKSPARCGIFEEEIILNRAHDCVYFVEKEVIE